MARKRRKPRSPRTQRAPSKPVRANTSRGRKLHDSTYARTIKLLQRQTAFPDQPAKKVRSPNRVRTTDVLGRQQRGSMKGASPILGRAQHSDLSATQKPKKKRKVAFNALNERRGLTRSKYARFKEPILCRKRPDSQKAAKEKQRQLKRGGGSGSTAPRQFILWC